MSNIEKKEWRERFIRDKSASFEISGKLALFSDPLLSMGGEKTTYMVPTYEGMKGVTKRIYWKPTFIWVVDQVRVMNPIRTESFGTRVPVWYGKEITLELSDYTYLTDVRYQVKVHLEWNMNRPEYAEDRDYEKHYGIFARALLNGGRLPIFLGKSECTAYVRPCVFGEGEGAYDHSGMISFGGMYYGISYPDEAKDEAGAGKLMLNQGPVVMKDGVITYEPPEKWIRTPIRSGAIKVFHEKGEDADNAVV